MPRSSVSRPRGSALRRAGGPLDPDRRLYVAIVIAAWRRITYGCHLTIPVHACRNGSRSAAAFADRSGHDPSPAGRRAIDVVAIELVGDDVVAHGAAFERFEESTADVATWLAVARDRHPSRLIAAGHSIVEVPTLVIDGADHRGRTDALADVIEAWLAN